METVGNRRISLPPDLYNELEEIARKKGKTISIVIQEAMRVAKKRMTERERLKLRFLDT